MLSQIKGVPPTGEPEAEQWMGAHPRGLSVLVDADGGETPLPANSIPFLFKILTAEKGLSIQAHPSKVQAEEGYARENEAGIPIDAAHRNYRDANHKPELICGITDFWGLRGFRPLSAILFDLLALCDTAPDLPDEFVAAVRDFEEDPTPKTWRRTFLRLLEIGGSEPSRGALVSAAERLARRRGTVDPKEGHRDRSDRFWWVLELQRQFPGDPGTIAPLYLNLVHLAPGEAMYLDAQTLHAYLYGAGVEIMANSDNVLRSGCTVKHVDVEELSRVLVFDTTLQPVIRPDRGKAVWRYETPAAEFELHRVELKDNTAVEGVRGNGPVIVVAIGGGVAVSEGAGAITIASGESAYIESSPREERPSGESTFTIAAAPENTTPSASLNNGSPTAFVATLPGSVTFRGR